MKKLPKIALGAWAWGNDGTFGNSLDEISLRQVFDSAMSRGFNLWDTAYAYGMGASEKTLAAFIKGLPREDVLVSDKFTPQCVADPQSPSQTVLKEMHDMQLKLMDLDRFDIYWIHNTVGAPGWTEQLAILFENREDAPLIGVSNHNLEEIRKADAILKAHGLRVSAVQNHYSLLNRSSERSGILEWCRSNRAVFFSYMVLEQGALSGKYDTAHPMPEGSARAAVYNPMLGKLEILNAELTKIAETHGTEAAQIPVAWAIAKGTLPIIGVTRPTHVEGAARAAAIELSTREIADLESVADRLELDTIRFWEKEMK